MSYKFFGFCKLLFGKPFSNFVTLLCYDIGITMFPWLLHKSFCLFIFIALICGKIDRDWQIIVLAHYNFNVQSNLQDTRCITPKRVTSLRSPSPSGNIALQNKVAAVASHRQQCVQFHRREIRTSDLSFQKQTRYRSTNWSVILRSLF